MSSIRLSVCGTFEPRRERAELDASSARVFAELLGTVKLYRFKSIAYVKTCAREFLHVWTKESARSGYIRRSRVAFAFCHDAPRAQSFNPCTSGVVTFCLQARSARLAETTRKGIRYSAISSPQYVRQRDIARLCSIAHDSFCQPTRRHSVSTTGAAKPLGRCAI